jgi:hypothetical protein
VKSKRWHILSVFILEDYLAIDLFQGSFNGERFLGFVRDHVLPRINKWPLSRSILVVDNASSHNEQVFESDRSLFIILTRLSSNS